MIFGVATNENRRQRFDKMKSGKRYAFWIIKLRRISEFPQDDMAVKSRQLTIQGTQCLPTLLIINC